MFPEVFVSSCCCLPLAQAGIKCIFLVILKLLKWTVQLLTTEMGAGESLNESSSRISRSTALVGVSSSLLNGAASCNQCSLLWLKCNESEPVPLAGTFNESSLYLVRWSLVMLLKSTMEWQCSVNSAEKLNFLVFLFQRRDEDSCWSFHAVLLEKLHWSKIQAH